jgi:hypothetical protein
MKTSTKAKCEAFAARHSLQITVKRFDGICYSVDLPKGLITESGNTGLGGTDDEGDMRMPEIWGAILEDMESLVSEKWIPNPDL